VYINLLLPGPTGTQKKRSSPLLCGSLPFFGGRLKADLYTQGAIKLVIPPNLLA